MTSHVIGALALLLSTLAIGMAGYHWLEDQAWIDAYLNATMILGGMGPVSELHSTGGKFFALNLRALPGPRLRACHRRGPGSVLHRAVHRFHLDGEE
jgi:hypothetical protein